MEPHLSTIMRKMAQARFRELHSQRKPKDACFTQPNHSILMFEMNEQKGMSSYRLREFPHMAEDNTVLLCRMPKGKWRETKLQPGKVKSGHQLSCC